ETLFHPSKRFDYDGSLPATHWIDDAPSSLLVRRKESWNVVDLETGEESPCSVEDQLTRRLQELEGVDEKQARRSAISIVGNMKSSDETVLARLEKSLAIVSASKPARWLTRDAASWGNATIDPTARRVAYTRDGDLFVVDAETDRSLRLTNDGTDTLLDGVLDWTYQEEIFGRGNFRGFWFSPDGQWLAMLRIDISGIQPYTLSAASSQRGKGNVSRYPKAGDPIPQAELLVWDLREFESGVVPPPKSLVKSTRDQELIVTGVWWHAHQHRLVFCVSDRLQTWRELHMVDREVLVSSEQQPSLLIREESPAWVEPPAPPAWLADGSLVWRSEVPSGRTRLYHLSADGQIVTPASPDQFDVRNFWVSGDGEVALVTGDAERGTVQQHAYRIDLKAGAGSPTLVSLTDGAGWHATDISPDGKWLVDRFSTPMKPARLSVRSVTDASARVLAEASLSVVDSMVQPELLQIPTADGFSLPALLFKPVEASGSQPSAVVMEVYGGPQAPVVSSRWQGAKTLYRQLLAKQGIATLVVDNRSSAGHLSDTWVIRHRVGEVEMQDVQVAVDWLKSQTWVDPGRLAIRGWSFGGFLTLYAMTHSEDFAAGIAGGSVTDWAEYDAFYTERYMGMPKDNVAGYAATAPVARAAKLHGRVLLIHGESDDNVHPSNTMRMAGELQKAGKDFRLMIYPGAAHAIHNPQQAWHMAQMTHRFLLSELSPGGP
ncbi:MAG: DPP IV N-terminal domain-containing protein, partial [Rubripirellula sp.]